VVTPILRKGQRDLALRDYNSAIKLNPNHVLAYSGRGEVHFVAGNYDRAIEDLGIAIRLDPKDSRPYFFRGRSYSKKGEYERAISDFTLAINLKIPHLALAHLARGDAYENQGEFKKAISEYETASNLDPQSGLAKEAAVAIQRIGRKAVTQNVTPAPKVQSTGSGFAVNKNGYVLTNHHVIEGCSKVQLRWSNRVNETSIVGPRLRPPGIPSTPTLPVGLQTTTATMSSAALVRSSWSRKTPTHSGTLWSKS
jgi:tetratricopeptide (TPR) repeat protein